MTTGLPSTNNFWLLSMVGGILLVFFGISKIDHTHSYLTEQLEYSKNQLSESKNQLEELKNITLNTEIIESLHRKKEITSKEYNIAEKLIKENEAILKTVQEQKLQDESDNKIKELEFKIKKLRTSYYNYIGYCSILFGLILFSIGYYRIFKLQAYRDKILFNEYLNLNVKHEDCQSCGMKLVNDKNFDKKSNYCSNCYQNNEFTTKDLTVSEFKEIVNTQLIAKGINSIEKKNILSKINSLERWKTKFDWEK